jgi:hypothetical protein
VGELEGGVHREAFGDVGSCAVKHKVCQQGVFAMKLVHTSEILEEKRRTFHLLLECLRSSGIRKTQRRPPLLPSGICGSDG